jgi:hypothetical protein
MDVTTLATTYMGAAVVASWDGFLMCPECGVCFVTRAAPLGKETALYVLPGFASIIVHRLGCPLQHDFPAGLAIEVIL